MKVIMQDGFSKKSQRHSAGRKNGIKQDLLVVSTPLKNISQIGNLPQVGVTIKNMWDHHPEDKPNNFVTYFTSTIAFEDHFLWNLWLMGSSD